jgi:hypothetical protein
MKKRSLIGLSLAVLTPLFFAGCLFFDSGSPTNPDGDDTDRPDEDGEGDDVTLQAPAEFQGSPLDGLVYFV